MTAAQQLLGTPLLIHLFLHHIIPYLPFKIYQNPLLYLSKEIQRELLLFEWVPEECGARGGQQGTRMGSQQKPSTIDARLNLNQNVPLDSASNTLHLNPISLHELHCLKKASILKKGSYLILNMDPATDFLHRMNQSPPSQHSTHPERDTPTHSEASSTAASLSKHLSKKPLLNPNSRKKRRLLRETNTKQCPSVAQIPSQPSTCNTRHLIPQNLKISIHTRTRLTLYKKVSTHSKAFLLFQNNWPALECDSRRALKDSVLISAATCFWNAMNLKTEGLSFQSQIHSFQQQEEEAADSSLQSSPSTTYDSPALLFNPYTEILIHSLQHFGASQLQQLPESLQNHSALVLSAVSSQAQALRHASHRLQNDAHFVQSCLSMWSHDESSLAFILKHMGKSLQSNPDVFLCAIKHHVNVLGLSVCSEILQCEEFLEKAIQIDARVLGFVPRNMEGFCRRLLQWESEAPLKQTESKQVAENSKSTENVNQSETLMEMYQKSISNMRQRVNGYSLM